MIEDVLSLSKIEEGVVTIKSEELDVADVLKEIISELEETNPGRTIKSELPSTIVNSDFKLIKHIFQNIIDNAFKYTPEGKEINITLIEEIKNIKVTVTDQGIGIPKDDQAKLFERFHRANNVANIKGTGLRLNIVKKYIDELNGKITFSSAENKGTEFTIILPKKI